jgi:ubiquinone/menaquinone biosynthesis C-methylase UbiE
MSTSPDPRGKERPSTYFVQDRESQAEFERLTIQDQMITSGMGGVLPEQPDPSGFRRVLDVGCGTGQWLIELAQQYPTMSLFGIDISKRMIDYARAQAEIHNVADRIEFAVMDALLILEFPPEFFDLANVRCSGSFMRTWEWPKLLSELLRVTRSEGVVRDTEPEIIIHSNSPAHEQIFEMFQHAMFQSGHLFKENTTGIIDHLPQLFIQHGFQQVQTRDYALKYPAGTAQGQAYYNDMQHFFGTIRPFLQKWGAISGDYEAIQQQALEEMQQSTFCATWNFRTAWGIVE